MIDDKNNKNPINRVLLNYALLQDKNCSYAF